MCSWFLFWGIKESPCFMSGLTLREDKGEMVVIRNKVLVTFEASFDIHPFSLALPLSSFPPTTSLLSFCLTGYPSPPFPLNYLLSFLTLCDLPQTTLSFTLRLSPHPSLLLASSLISLRISHQSQTSISSKWQKKILYCSDHFRCLFGGIIFFFTVLHVLYEAHEKALWLVCREVTASNFATGFEGLSGAVSFVDSPSEHVPLVEGWVSLVTHLREHAVPSLFPLNNVNGPRYISRAAGAEKHSHINRQKGSPMQTHTHTQANVERHRHLSPLSVIQVILIPPQLERHVFPSKEKKEKMRGNRLIPWVRPWDAHFLYASVDASVYCMCLCSVCGMSVHPSNSSVPIPAETWAMPVPPLAGEWRADPSSPVFSTPLPLPRPRDNVKSRSQLKWMGNPVHAG